jgi:hypothetical protein
MSFAISFSDVQSAAERLRDVATVTPGIHMFIFFSIIEK